jgi:hypothetical protein
MPNYLDFTCPKCRSGDGICVAVVITAKFLPERFVIDNPPELDIWSCSGASCEVCGFEGEAKEFMPLTEDNIINFPA